MKKAFPFGEGVSRRLTDEVFRLFPHTKRTILPDSPFVLFHLFIAPMTILTTSAAAAHTA